MTQYLQSENAPQRFAGVFSSEHSTKRAAFDRVILEGEDFVVTPTLGSILPLWLLVIPRAPALRFSILEKQNGGGSTFARIHNVLERLGVSAERAIWFEHGPLYEKSPIGCGVDQAHLHVLVDPCFTLNELASSASLAGSFAWELAFARDAYTKIGHESSYIVMGDFTIAHYAKSVDHLESQFLRRQIARLAGEPAAWNYRTHPHLDNVHKTLTAFRNSQT